jgi:aspartyl-tRNA(Asn)/glutamyl-tRNA(Gln) amidotransferase subunit A
LEHTSIKHTQSQVLNGESDCRTIVENYLEQITKKKHLNAFLEVYADEALLRADAITQKIRDNKAGKLAGLVIGLKDNISFKGHHVSGSSKILEGFEAIYNATVTQRLLEEDAIIIGRLNCDEFAMGASNENSAYGPVLNDADNTKVPGGSSGGAAVAVQAGLCMATLGSDTGGSIRQPASFTGTVGIKPTYGRVSRWGLLAYASSFDQIGPITTNVADCALILEVIAGDDNHDATASEKDVPEYSQFDESISPKRIAYISECLESEGLDPEIKSHLESNIAKLQADGHTVEAVSFPYLDYMVPCYYVLTTAEASSNLSRYSGLMYGHRSDEAEDLNSTFIKSRTEGFGEEVKRRIMTGTFVLSAGYYEAYYSKAQKVRRIIQDKSFEILDNYDFMLLPTTPTTAFDIGAKADDPIAMYLADIFTVQAPLAGLPAISLPTAVHNNGMPFGVQLMAKPFAEKDLLSFSNYLLKLNYEN